jgi:hypothetical protein
LKRIALLLSLAVLAVLMLRASLANILRYADPALALSLNSANSEAAEARAEALMLESANNRAEAAILARRALERSPVSAAAARILAITYVTTGDEAATRRLIRYSESLSRRDLPTQAWLIEDAVQHNDVRGALRHYDIALRATRPAEQMLFPVLFKAIAQPAVVDGLVDTLAVRPPWGDAFLLLASREATDLDGLARLIAGVAKRDYPLPVSVAPVASARMVDAAQYDDAWRVYAATNHGAVRDIVRDPSFIHATAGAGPFAWSIMSGNGLMAEPRRYGAQNALAYAAETGAGGAVARQLLLLPGGSFRLAGRSFERAPDAPPAQIRLTCAGSGEAIALVPAADATFSQGFVVPAGCPAQLLDVVVDGGDNPLGASGGIGNLHILRDRGNQS